MTLSGTSFWTLVRRRVKSWKLIRSRDEILKNFGKWRKTARFYVSVKIVLQHSNKTLKLHANLEVIKIFQMMKNFELFHQNFIKKYRGDFIRAFLHIKILKFAEYSPRNSVVFLKGRSFPELTRYLVRKFWFSVSENLPRPKFWPIFEAIDNLQSLIFQFGRVTEH